MVGYRRGLGIVDVGYVDTGDVLGSGYVRHVEDAPAVPGLVQGHALSDVPITVQVMVGYQFHVLDFLSASRHHASITYCSTSSVCLFTDMAPWRNPQGAILAPFLRCAVWLSRPRQRLGSWFTGRP